MKDRNKNLLLNTKIPAENYILMPNLNPMLAVIYTKYLNMHTFSQQSC